MNTKTNKITTTTKTKAVPVKKTATSKKKAATKRKTSLKSTKITTIKAHVDVGWGNHLFIRGSGGGLKWEVGQKMDWKDGDWTWSTAQTNEDGIEFKFLINDEIWAEGENLVVCSGDSYTSIPGF